MGRPTGHTRVCGLLDAGYVTARASELYTILQRTPSLRTSIGLLLPERALDTSPPSSRQVRSIFMPGWPWGWPLTRPYVYDTSAGLSSGFQADYEPYEQLHRDAISQLLDQCGVPRVRMGSTRLSSACVIGQLDVVPVTGKVMQVELLALLSESLVFVVLAVAIMVVYLWLHLRW